MFHLCRGSLHFHSPLTGVLNPHLLQTILHSPMFAEAIAKVYNSMVVTELPTYLHVRCLLERIDPELRKQKKNLLLKHQILTNCSNTHSSLHLTRTSTQDSTIIHVSTNICHIAGDITFFMNTNMLYLPIFILSLFNAGTAKGLF